MNAEREPSAADPVVAKKTHELATNEQEAALRAIVTAILLTAPMLAPVLAQAQETIPDAALKETFDECVPACQERNSYAFCASVCGCVANEMERHWTMADLRARGEMLEEDMGDASVRAEVGRIAEYCASRQQ